MDPVRRAFWRLLTRCGATIAAVVALGSVPVTASRSAAASRPQDSEENGDLVLIAVGARPIAPSHGDRMPSRRAPAEGLGILEPRLAPFEAHGRPEPLVPEAMEFLEWPDVRVELATKVYEQSRGDSLADLGDALLKGPEMLIGGVHSCLGGLLGGGSYRTWAEEGSQGVTGRVLDLQFEARPQRISAAFMQQWTERERRYLAGFAESRVDTYGFEDGTEDADLRELAIDQRKVFWAALRRTYLVRYKMQFDEQIPEGSWALGRWSGADFVVLPPLMAGYLYYRGLEQKISMGETSLRITFEPVCELIRGDHDRSMAAALEWTIKGFPVGLIVSVGLEEGRYGLDFVGIGTSLGAVRRALANQPEDLRR